MTTNKVFPPWDEKQVNKLQQWQNTNFFHHFTCNNYSGCDTVLLPMNSGWLCPKCSGGQVSWCYDFMLKIT